MHIAFFNPQGNFDRDDSYLAEHPDFGGQLVYVKELAMAIVQAGHSVDIITRRIRDPEWPEFASSIDYYDSSRELRIVRIPCGGESFIAKEQLWDHLPEFVSETLRFYGEKLPEFATAHYGDGGYCAALMQSVTGLGFTFTGHSLGAQKLDKLGADTSSMESMEDRFAFSKRIDAERLAMSRSFRIITSTWQERMEQYNHPLYAGAVDVDDDESFSVVPPGVNSSVFTIEGGAEDEAVERMLQQELSDPEQPHFVISSRIDDKKNIGNAVAAYCDSPELNERAGFAICIRGIDDPYREISSLAPDEQQVLQPILDRIRSAGLKERVSFLDIQSQSELAATYRRFAERKSVFVLPSVYEPFGLAPIEAAACGLACVATKNGGPSEIFDNGSGVLVDPFDVSDIARGLEEALHNQEDLARRAQKRVAAKYTWEKTAAGYLDVIREGVRAAPVPLQPVPELAAGSRIEEYLARASKGQQVL